MKFIEQFNTIINNQQLQKQVVYLLDYGSKDPMFINYFGVNFDEKNIVSIKFYFSFFIKPSIDFFKRMSFSDHHFQLVEDYWGSPNKYDFMHQGLTIGLKCYLKNDQLSINNYFHFRSNKLKQVPAKFINLTKGYEENIPGICVENHGGKEELKNYFYITSEINKNEILDEFNIPLSESEKITLIEYTESKLEKKVNLIYNKSEDIHNYFLELNNPYINELNKYIFEKYDLYFYGPGFRHNSSTKAIYYVSKQSFYELFQEQTIPKLIK